MTDILDTQNDFSAIATSLSLAVSTGAEIFSLFGGSQARALVNWANQAAPLVMTGNPAVGASGAAVDSADYFTLPSNVTQDNSETYLIVMNANSPAQPTANLVGYTSNGQTNSFNYGETLLGASNGYPGPTANFGLLNASAAPATGSLSIGGNNAATWAAQALPSFFALTIDMTNMIVTWQCLSAANWAAVSGTFPLTKTYAIPSGYTRPTTVYPGRVGGNFASAALANTGLVHFFAKYSRALSSVELASVYAQVKGILAKRAVSI